MFEDGKELNCRKTYLLAIGLLVFSAFLFLAYVTYYINFWPSDSLVYIRNSARLEQLHYVPEIFKNSANMTFLLSCKESLLIGIYFLQKMLGDFKTLFPNILLLILSVNISAVLIYWLGRKLLNEHAGFLAFLLFFFSFWPYQYVLQGAHSPLALMFFLLCVVLMLYSAERPVLLFFSGVSLGLMLCSSPSAPLYLPYLTGVVFYLQRKHSIGIKIRRLTVSAGLFITGILVAIGLLAWPDPLYIMKMHMDYLEIVQTKNHFFIFNQPLQLSPEGRVAWIFQYFFLIMPGLFFMYLLSLLYILRAAVKRPALLIFFFCCIAVPFCVEISRVPQFGRNYFPWLPVIIAGVCYMFYDWHHIRWPYAAKSFKLLITVICAFLLGAYVFFNTRIFFTDVLPSRMATRNIYLWLEKNQVNSIFVHSKHPFNRNIGMNLINPKYTKPFFAGSIESIEDVREGYILVSPLTGKTIYRDCTGETNDFQQDPALNELLRSGEFSKFVAASFPTLSSSRIWTQEEEICSHQDLILRRISDADRALGYAWILDAAKLQREWFSKRYPESLSQHKKIILFPYNSAY